MTSTKTYRRGMWVWNGYGVATSPAAFITECKRIKITDVYLYFTASNYTRTDVLRKFIKQLTLAGIKAWGLDGARAYFSDAKGPGGIYASIRALVAYNKLVNPDERFYGFQTDNEPDDYSGKFPDTFHNDIKTSRLSKTGSGVFMKTQWDDRQFILQDWVRTQKQCTLMLRAASLRSGAALPSWLEDYYGEPLTVSFDGKTQTVMAHMFDHVDDYCIMSYQTDLSKVKQRVASELAYGNRLIGKAVFPGVETVRGRGPAVSYGNHSTKNKKSAVLKDIVTMEGMFGGNSCFAGVNIHDWIGWTKLPA